ncbi:hypothetical protein CPB84DRAFT_1692758 [Gymnopilus junonius]|uniref:Uncharacterized protein n=1 Tax=Gymnopilus junonius TaxID=109634 RepID=A0A9P5N9U7_GYMJU|nr:hypothetical protein CPB84DRAFT_1692758 [Gymnopilus junonius]
MSFISNDVLANPGFVAKPCQEDGTFFDGPLPDPVPLQHPDATPGNDWGPFEDRIAFDFTEYHYIQLQSSVAEITKGIDILLANSFKHGCQHNEGLPNGWRRGEDMYETIDSIQSGDAPWKTYKFQYTGPKPSTPPRWMEEIYELSLRDILLVLRYQHATPEFKDKFDSRPYQEFDPQGNRVFSNLMSGDWAYRQADIIAKDPQTHGAMLVPVIAGSDKTTVSVATGHQEYHPVYASSGLITNTARQGHGNGVTPFAFLPIPKASKSQRKKATFQKFCRQLYHKCLEFAFVPLRQYMTSPMVLQCPDGHFRRAIFSLGPYIADYPEQVWLATIVSNWCPKCDAKPDNLDDPSSHRRSHEKTDYLIKNFDPGILWDDPQPFTHSFPHADIHELLSPDLLHQLIKGTFKDHLVDWVGEYLTHQHGQAAALEIMDDIDRRYERVSAVPPYPGLRRFPDGRDFTQWTGDDSKALMKVYLAAIAGYLPSAIVQSIAIFMDACYIARRNAISAPVLQHLKECVETFHQVRTVFIALGVCASISLPRQHALFHYWPSIQLFGSPNGLCSSITESKHIKAVKEPWRRSNRYKALGQMLQTLMRLSKLAALHQFFVSKGMLAGTTSSYMARTLLGKEGDEVLNGPLDTEMNNEEEEVDDIEPASGNPPADGSLSDHHYPRELYSLAEYIGQPDFPLAFCQFLFECKNPNSDIPNKIEDCPSFRGKIYVHHSAVATFYAPSDLCGTGGMHREHICSTPSFHGHARRDTAFVVLDEEKPGMEGMAIARVHLFFSFQYREKDYSCALVNWYVPTGRDHDTGMWTVKLNYNSRGCPIFQVIDVDAIARGVHLLPVYGSQRLPEDFTHHDALDSFRSFFINHYIDHHAHEFLVN